MVLRPVPHRADIEHRQPRGVVERSERWMQSLPSLCGTTRRTANMDDPINAFVPGPRVRIEGATGGPLQGLTFAAKDLFDVAGHPTGGGNHDWARTNPVPTRHAWAVQRLLDAGVTLIGKTITDEVSLGILLGENAFDGTPLNSKAPDRVPGGVIVGLGRRGRCRAVRHGARHR